MRIPISAVTASAACWCVLVAMAAGTRAQSEPSPVEAVRPVAVSRALGRLRPVAARRPATASEVQDLVYFAPERPIFVRLKIRVLGDGFRSLRSRYARRLFQSLDDDDDGVLNEVETRNVPPSDQLLPPRGPREPPRTFNDDPVDADADGVVTREELNEYVRKSIGKPFVFKSAPPRAGRVDLFAVTDADGDGMLDGDETRSADRAILKFDANDDEIVDERELSTAGTRRAAGESSADESRELISQLAVIDSESGDAVEELFAQLVKRYDKPHVSEDPLGGDSVSDGRLDADELSVSPEQIAAWDNDGDGRLDVVEGRLLLCDPVVGVEISATLGGNSDTPAVSLAFQAEGGDAVGIFAAPSDRGGLEVTIGGEGLDLVVGESPSPLDVVRRRFDQRFEAADADANDYLDTEEAARLGIVPVAFSGVDRDGDQMVQKDELLEYADLQALLFGSRVALLLSRDPESILDLIDDGADRRLGLRELRAAPKRILTWDLNGDGSVESNEIPANSRLILQNATMTLFRPQSLPGATQRNADQPSSGPVWFRKMDRNRDGDLSPREFLGPIKTFHRLDQNADGLLSADESLEVE